MKISIGDFATSQTQRGLDRAVDFARNWTIFRAFVDL